MKAQLLDGTPFTHTHIPHHIDDLYDGVSIELNRFKFSFSVSESPWCCGSYEIGNFSSYSADNHKKECEALEIVFKKILAGTQFNLFIHTIDTHHCKIVEEVVQRNDMFTHIKTFVNPNTNKTIKMWVNNNNCIE